MILVEKVRAELGCFLWIQGFALLFLELSWKKFCLLLILLGHLFGASKILLDIHSRSSKVVYRTTKVVIFCYHIIPGVYLWGCEWRECTWRLDTRDLLFFFWPFRLKVGFIFLVDLEYQIFYSWFRWHRSSFVRFWSNLIWLFMDWFMSLRYLIYFFSGLLFLLQNL